MNHEQQSWMTLGDNAFNNGYYPDALSYYTQGLQQDTNNTLLLSKIGNTYYAMQMYPTSITFYEEALIISNAFSVIYEYALDSMQQTDLYMLQENLRIQYQVDIIPEGLQFIISNIQQELQEKPSTSSKDIKKVQPWEHLIIKLFKKAGIPFPGEILDIAHQIKNIIPEKNPEKHSMNLTKRMTWVQFENFLQRFFEQKGYNVTRTKKSHDYGADLILRRPGESIVIQVKKRKQTIGVKSVQETYSAKAYYQTNHAILITTSKFSRPALKLADKIGVECWDYEQLLKELQKP